MSQDKVIPKKYVPILIGLINEVNENYPDSAWKSILKDIKKLLEDDEEWSQKLILKKSLD